MLPSMAPSARIVAYYIINDASKEIVADSLTFEVGGAFARNPVS